MTRLETVSGRILPSTVQRLDRIADTLAARRPGEVVKRSDAIRIAIERGVEVLERELDIGSPEASALPAPPKGAKRPASKPAKK